MKVAVIVPTYNNAATVVETLESLQNQTGDLSALTEICLTDDSSRDNTAELARACWKHHVPLNINSNEKNLGERGNVNNAIARLSENNDWVLLLHSDDIAKPHWFATMTARMRQCAPEVASISSSWDDLFPDGSIVTGEDNNQRPPEHIAGNVESVRGTLRQGCWWHVSGCALRTSAFAKIGGFKLHLPQCGDWEWVLRCLQAGQAIEYVPRTLILYRQHEASVSAASFQIDRDLRESFEIIQLYAPLVAKPDLARLHLKMASAAFRRMGKALLYRRLGRAGRALQTFLMAWQSLFASLWRQRPAPEQEGL